MLNFLECTIKLSKLRAGLASWGVWCCVGLLSCFAPPGAVPVVGGFLDPSVPRSPGVAPRKGEAAHGPRHLALHIALRFVRVCDRLPHCVLLVFFLCRLFWLSCLGG